MEPIPAHVQVGPHRYTVVADAAKADELNTNHGQTDNRLARIVIHPGQARTQLRDTLLHETLHAILDGAGMANDGVSVSLPGDEELVVSRLSPLLLDTLRRNPDLVAVLLEDADETNI